MSIKKRLAVGLVAFLASTAFVGTASAACSGSTCSLGGQTRFQIGNGLPIPISFNFAQTYTTMQLTSMLTNTKTTGGGPGVPANLLKKFDYLVTSMGGFGMPGLVKATTLATVQQQDPAPAGTPSTAPRSLMVAPAQFKFNQALFSIGVVKANAAVFAVQTDLSIVGPHPTHGTVTFSAGGRTGNAIVSWCAGQPAPSALFDPGCLSPSSFGVSTTTTGGLFTNKPRVNGLIRYTATKNQFGGNTNNQTIGTAMVFFNPGIPLGSLPCTFGPVNTATNAPGLNPLCFAGVSQVTPDTGMSAFGKFASKVSNSAYTAQTGFFTGTIGVNGTIFGLNQVSGTVSNTKGPLPFTGQAATSWGFPNTTGRLTISVTKNQDAPTEVEVFRREGTDMRTAGGQGIVVMVSGAVSKRSLSGPNANRGWATLNVPEPSTIFAASAGLFALFGCHQLARRRRS